MRIKLIYTIPDIKKSLIEVPFFFSSSCFTLHNTQVEFYPPIKRNPTIGW